MENAYLEKKVPEENMFRFYSIHITPTLFGSWSLIRQWGRIGCSGSKMEEWFDSENSAFLTGEKILKKKEKRGYRISQTVYPN